MTPASNTGPWYTPQRDGSLDEYLQTHRGGVDAFPLFKGYQHYKELWDSGYLEPEVSVIRVMWCMGRQDEHYLVTGEHELEGLEAAAHSGRPGKHDPREILTGRCPPWEAHDLNPQPVARTTSR